MQKKHSEWFEQWSRFKAPEDYLFLFQEWIFPNTLQSFAGKSVLDAGCGHGPMIRHVAPLARRVTGVDLNTAELAAAETRHMANVGIVEGDLAEIAFPELFDAVYCVGVIHHTDDPDRTFENLKKLTKPGGRLIIWAYSREGNFLNRTLLEWAKRLFFLRLPKPALAAAAAAMTVLLYPIVWSLYLLPLGALPFYEYFSNFRKLSFRQNLLNVFDKLNAPQTHFISREQIARWFSPGEFADVHISPYKGVSWRASGTRR